MMWNTRVLDDNIRQVCDTCFGRKANPNAVWSKRHVRRSRDDESTVNHASDAQGTSRTVGDK